MSAVRLTAILFHRSAFEVSCDVRSANKVKIFRRLDARLPARTLAFIHRYYRRHQLTPFLREIAVAQRISISSAHKIVMELASRGYIKVATKQQPRTISIIDWRQRRQEKAPGLVPGAEVAFRGVVTETATGKSTDQHAISS